MKYLKLFSLLLCRARRFRRLWSTRGCANKTCRVGATSSFDVSVFYDELAPYGRWFTLEGYGWVWTPYGVSVGWRPYTYGYWVYTDYGWTWVSRWRWG